MTERGAGRRGGFTLIEVLVALAVIGLALGAALTTTAASIRAHEHVRHRTLASWLAMDLRAELILAQAAPDFVGDQPVRFEQFGQPFLGRALAQENDEGLVSGYLVEVWADRDTDSAVTRLPVSRGAFE